MAWSPPTGPHLLGFYHLSIVATENSTQAQTTVARSRESSCGCGASKWTLKRTHPAWYVTVSDTPCECAKDTSDSFLGCCRALFESAAPWFGCPSPSLPSPTHLRAGIPSFPAFWLRNIRQAGKVSFGRHNSIYSIPPERYGLEDSAGLWRLSWPSLCYEEQMIFILNEWWKKSIKII